MLAQQRLKLMVLAVVIVALLAAVTILTHNSFTRPYPSLNDFMSRWEGARSYWRDGLNPYSDEASLNIQVRIYGRAVEEGEDPGFFAYPFYTVFVVGPLVNTTYAWASAVWMVLLEACLVASVFLLINLFDWKPKPLVLGLLVLWSLFFYPSARGLLLGQPGHLVYLLEIVAIWALVKGRDDVAGVALAFSTIKPQMGFLIVPFLLLWGLRARRLRFLISFGAVFGGLMLASFLLQPTWLSDWITQIQRYPSYTALGSPVWIVMQQTLGLGDAGEWAVNLVFYALMLWAWFGVLVQQHHERFLWAVVVTLVVTHLVAPRTATPHYVIFMLPLVFFFRELVQRFRRQGSLYVSLILVALLVLPWLHFLLTVEGEFEHPTVYLPLPFAMVFLIWITRKLWWAKAPRPAETANTKTQHA